MNPFRPHPTQHTFTQRSPAAERVRRRTVAFIILAGLLAALVPLNSQAQLAVGSVSPAAASVPAQQANTCGVRTIDLTVSVYRVVPAGALRTLYDDNIRYFADAVYEMSNCAHKIRNVTFYQNGTFADKADIQWVAATHPSASISGYGTPGKLVNHADSFGLINFINPDSTNERRFGGYTIGHEWGHYYYSQFDEYKGGTAFRPEAPGDPAVEDTPVSPSVMHQTDNAASERNYAWLNFSTGLNDTMKTAQHRIYGASSWETLARPVAQDPRDGARTSEPARLYYPELANYAPLTDAIPSPLRIDLPTSPTAYLDAADQPGNPARSVLNITWLEPSSIQMIVIDVSQRLGENNRQAAVREAVQRLIGKARLNLDAVGLVVYDSTARVIQAPLLLATEQDRTTLLSKVNTILATSTVAASLGDGLQAALDQFATVTDSAKRHRYVSVIATTLPTTGTTSLNTVLPRLHENRISVYSIGYEVNDQAAAILRSVGTETGGGYTYAGQPAGARGGLALQAAGPDDLEELTKALLESNQEASAASEVEIDQGSAELAAGATLDTPLLIDGTLQSLNVDVFQTASVSATLSLRAPDGTPSAAPSCEGEGDDSFCTFTVAAPVTGTWTLRAVAGAAPVELDFRADGDAGPTPTFNVEVQLITGEDITYPAPILVNAIVTGPSATNENLRIAMATVTGTLEATDGSTTPFSLRDDGVAPDNVPFDGQYAALLSDYPSNGDFIVQVEASNANGTAMATHDGFQPAPGPIDPNTGLPIIPVPAPQLVRRNFVRNDTAQVFISGVPAPGTIPAAINIAANNNDIDGKIERAGEVSRYRIAVPATFAGMLNVRVTDVAQGMRPRLRVLGPDGTVLVDRSLANPTERGYLAVSVPVTPGTTITAEVSHIDPAARGGLFVLSAGTRLPGDGAVVFLPFVRR